MRFSWQELKRWAQLDATITVAQGAEAINAIGFEVEQISPVADVAGLQFGQVLTVTKNPEGDQLYVCEIKFADKVRTIQTTATNVKPNMYVCAFVPGSRSGQVVFAAKKMRGIVSEGMLASFGELGIDEQYLRPEWAVEIPLFEDVDLTTDPIKYFGLDDTMIEVDILTNRSDAASYWIMARELAAYFKTNFSLPPARTGQLPIPIQVTNGAAHSLTFVGAKAMDPVTLGEQILLAKHHIKAINDWTDLANLCLIYTGQPTHVYPLDKVKNKFATKSISGTYEVFGSKAVALDHDLVVTHNGTPAALASTIGFEAFKVTRATKLVGFECGIFPSQAVRQAAKHARLTTPSSLQGARQIALGTTKLAIHYLATKLTQFSPPINYESPSPLPIPFSLDAACAVAGIVNRDDPHLQRALQALVTLGFKIDDKQVTVPVYRHDVQSQQDLNEELYRFYGYNNLQASPFLLVPPHLPLTPQPNFGNMLQQQGFQEVRTYSLVSQTANVINPFQFKKAIKLAMPLGPARAEIANSQAIELQTVAKYNYQRKMTDLNLFTTGQINDGVPTVCGFSSHKSFHDMQQVVTNLIPGATFGPSQVPTILHPNYSAIVYVDEQVVGWIGKLHPQHQTVPGIFCELIVAPYRHKIRFTPYQQGQLSVSDHNIKLAPHEPLGPKLTQYQPAFATTVVDQYQEGDQLKVTVRVKK